MQKEDIRITVHETLTALGFDVTEPQKAQADMLYLRNLRVGTELISSKIRIAIIMTLFSSVIFLIGKGVKSVFKSTIPGLWE